MHTSKLFIGARVIGALLLVQVVLPSPARALLSSGQIVTIAGNGNGGFSGDGGPATSAKIGNPYGTAIGPDGALYFVDGEHLRIRRIDPATGTITTIAGIGLPPGGYLSDGPNGDGGLATSAQIGDGITLAIDRARNQLYLPSTSLLRVRSVDLATGIINAFAGVNDMVDRHPGPADGDGGSALNAFLLFPTGLAVGPGGDVLITDGMNYRLRSVDAGTGVISRIAGIEGAYDSPIYETVGDGGLASAASFYNAQRVAVDAAGNIYVQDLQNYGEILVRRIDAVTGIIETIAGGGTTIPGSGPATDMRLVASTGSGDLLVDGGTLYIATNTQVFQVDLATGQLSPFAGTGASGFGGDGGSALAAKFNHIGGLARVPGGGLVVADSYNARLRYIAPDSIDLSGDASQSELHLPWVSELSGDLTVADNPNLTTIDLSSLATAGGDVVIADNTAASTIDLSSLTTTSGDLVIADNGSATVTDVSALTTVGGDLTIETTGSGVFDMSGAAVAGDAAITADGYSEVGAATAGGQTAVTMINGPATMELVLPAGAFPIGDGVAFSVQQLAADPVESWGEGETTTLAAYGFQFDIATLGLDATLNFEIDLAMLDPGAQAVLLDLLHTDVVSTLAVQGDDPGAALQIFGVCAAGVSPTAGGCVDVQWLDANRLELEPSDGVDPALLRFEALVGHFSSYHVVLVPEPATHLLLAAGLSTLALIARRRAEDCEAGTHRPSSSDDDAG